MDKKPYPQRKSPRLKDYDYAQDGAYFVTICTHQRKHWFGEIVNQTILLNDVGRVAESSWREIPSHFPEIELDAFVVMPNHVHGIIVLNRFVGTRYIASATSSAEKLPKLGTIIAAYKAAVSQKIHHLKEMSETVLWQERYHDHIIRNEQSWNDIRNYVIQNPARWHEDSLYSD